MSCTVTGEIIEKQIHQELRTYSELLGKDLSDGKWFDSRNDEDFEQIKNALQAIEAKYGSQSVMHYGGDLSDAIRIKIIVNSPEALENSYGQVLRGEMSDIERASSNKADYNLLSIDHMEAQFKGKQKELREFVGETAINMKKIFKIADTRNILYDEDIVDSNLRNRLKKIEKDLESASHADNFGEQIIAFADYLTEVNILTENINKVVQQIMDDPLNNGNSFIEINELAKIVNGHRLIIDDLSVFLTNGKIENPVVNSVLRTKRNIDAIESNWVKSAEDKALTDYMTIYTPINQAFIQKTEAAIAALEKSKAGKNKKQIGFIDKAIAKQKKNLADHSPSRENILATLRGERGDISHITSMIRSGITNPDFIISGMVDMFDRAMQKVRERMLGVENEFQRELDIYQKESGRIINTETAFDNMLIPRERRVFDWNTKEIKTEKSLQLITDHDPKFYLDQSDFEARINQQRYFVSLSKKRVSEIKDNLNAGHLAEDQINDLEYQTAKTQLEFAQNRLKETNKKRKDWETEHLSNELTDAWYAPDKQYLEQYVYKNAEGETVVSREQPNVPHLYLADYYSQYNREINNIFDAIKREDNHVPTQAQAKERKRLRQAKVKLRNIHDQIPGSLEFTAAQELSKYYKIKKEMYYYEVTDQKRIAFQKESLRVKRLFTSGKINKKQYQDWKNEMLTTTFTQEFHDERTRIGDAINKIIDSIHKDQGRTVDKTESDELWIQLRTLANKYRDNHGKINGQEFESDERDTAERIEREIIRLKNEANDLRNMDSTSKNRMKDLQRKRPNMYKALKELEKGSDEHKNLLDEINLVTEEIKAIQKKFPVNKSLQKDLDRLAVLFEEMAELSTNEPTDYYREEYDKQLQIFLQEQDIGQVPSEFSEKDAEGNTYIYKLKSDNTYTVETVGDPLPVPVRGDIELIWRNTFKKDFEQSDWFKANHIEEYKTESYVDGKGKTRYQQVLAHTPLYIWRHSFPKNQRQIKENEPSFAWTERIIKPEDDNGNRLITPEEDILLDPAGKKLPRRDSTYRTEWKEYDNRFESDPAGKRFLEFMRGQFHESQKNAYKPGQIMGDLIPAIERDFNVFDLNKDAKDIGVMKEQVLRNWTTTQQDIDTELGDVTGSSIQTLPVWYTGDLDTSLVSRNIYSSILRAVQAAAKHEIINEDILPTYKATELTLAKEGNRPQKNTKDAIANAFIEGMPDFIASKFRIKKVKDGAKSNNTRLDILQQTVNMLAYGESTIATDNWDIIGSSRKTRWDKIFHNILGYKSLTALAAINPAWGAAAQLGNFIGATTNQALKASIKHGNARFSWKDLLSAHKEFDTKYAGHLIKDIGKTGLKSKFGQMTDLFGVFDQLGNKTGEDIKKQTIRRNLISTDIFFFLKNGTETMLASTTFLATAKAHYIKNEDGEILVDGQGKKLNVMDAYKLDTHGNLIMREDLFDSDGNPSQWSEFDYNRFRGYMRRTQRDIDGAYGGLDKSLLQRSWYGSAIFWMKKFIVPFFENMYSKKRFNFEEGTHIEGFWRTTLVSIPDIIRYINASDVSNWNILGIRQELKEYLTHEQKDAFRQSRTQALILIALWLVLSQVMGYDDEDEDRFKKMKNQTAFTNWLTYGLLKGSGEAEQMVIPFGFDEVNKIIKNPMPQIIPYYSEVMKFMGDFNIDPTSNDPFLEVYKSGKNKGEIKAVSDFYKLLGYSTSKRDAESAIKGIEFLKRQ